MGSVAVHEKKGAVRVMAELNEVKTGLEHCAKDNCGGCSYDCGSASCIDKLFEDALEVITELEVVHCADCKHYMADANKCTSWTIYTEPTGFCHRAERAEHEKDG